MGDMNKMLKEYLEKQLGGTLLHTIETTSEDELYVEMTNALYYMTNDLKAADVDMSETPERVFDGNAMKTAICDRDLKKILTLMAVCSENGFIRPEYEPVTVWVHVIVKDIRWLNYKRILDGKPSLIDITKAKEEGDNSN